MELIDNAHSNLVDDGHIKSIRTPSKFNRDFIKNVRYKNTLLRGASWHVQKKVKQMLEDEKQIYKNCFIFLATIHLIAQNIFYLSPVLSYKLSAH